MGEEASETDCDVVTGGSSTHYFGAKAPAIANTLLQQNQLFISRNGQLWGRGYPHKEINLRGNATTTVTLVDSSTGEEFEQTNLDLAYREVFPGAIYSAQNGDGSIANYKSSDILPTLMLRHRARASQ